MLLRGTPQRRQSEGKKTEKTLRTTVRIGATRGTRCSARSIRRFRLSCAQLLKTALQSMVLARALGEPPTGNQHLALQYSNFSLLVQCWGWFLASDSRGIH